jgi:hypothetical protein
MAGFDGDTPESIMSMAQRLDEIGVAVPFLSSLTPYQGTPLHAKLEAEGRMLDDRGWTFYNGYNVTFTPKTMSAAQLLDAHHSLWKRAFSFRSSLKRWLRAVFLSLAMNGFYAAKRRRGNAPIDLQTNDQREPARRDCLLKVVPLDGQREASTAAEPMSSPTFPCKKGERRFVFSVREP